MASFRRVARKPYTRPAERDTGAPWVHDKAPGGFEQSRSTGSVGLGVVNAPANTKLVVSNLHYEISAKDLGDIFGKIGTLVREPYIRYDASGRSTGVAIITFETPEEASQAKKEYDGKLAKGQNIKIAFDTYIPGKKRATSAPSTTSLLNRIQKPPLKDRLSQDDTAIKAKPRGGGRSVGPIRTRGGRRGGGGGASGPAAAVTRKPRTAEDLDKELDAFMVDSTDGPAAPTPGPVAASDVVMTD